ncbi:MAG: PAS domain S-box protein [Kiritimatiellaeota bacterium]|nr:PAS domain S-box protein [Kiritimatiellota bacterium]
MEQLLKRMLQFTGDGVYRYTCDDGKILMANEGLVKLLDLEGRPEDLVGRRLHDLIRYTEQEGAIRRRLQEHGEIHGLLYHFQTLKGADRWVIHEAFMMRDPATGQQIVETLVKDVTALQQAERALSAEKERLLVTLRCIGDAVIVTDLHGRVTLMNPVAAEMTGWREAEALGQPLPEVFRIVNEQTRAPAANPVERVLATGSVVGLANHTVLIARDGKERPIADSSAPIRDPAGKLLGVVLVFQDATMQREAERVLRESAELFRAIFKNAGVGVVLTNKEGRFLDTNPMFQQMLGYSEAELRAKTVKDITHPDDLATSLEEIRAIWSSGADRKERLQLQKRYIRRDGSILCGRVTASAIRDAEGQPLFNVAMVEDITALIQAETSQHQYMAGLRAVIHLTQELSMMRTIDELLRGSMELGRARLDVDRLSVWQVDKPPLVIRGTYAVDEAGHMQDNHATSLDVDPQSSMGRVLRGASECEALEEMLTDHLARPVRAGWHVVVPLKSVTGLIQGILSADYLLSGRKPSSEMIQVLQLYGLTIGHLIEAVGAEESLDKEKERLVVTLRSIGDGVIATDADGQVQILNRAAEKLTGWSQAEAQQRPLDEVYCLLDSETRQPLGRDTLQSLISNGAFSAFPDETVLRSQDQKEYLISEVAVPIRDRESRIAGVVITFRDITDQRRQLEQAFTTHKLESLGILAGGIAHDFNNILTAILGNISLAQMSVQPQHQDLHELLTEVEHASLRAKELTHQLLTFAKGGAPIKQAMSPSEVIRESAGFALRGSSLGIEFRLPPDLWPAEIDPSQISHVIHNLVLNAAQAMPAGGNIVIAAENVTLDWRSRLPLSPGRYVKIAVADTGVGISEKHLANIFDPYFTTKAKGSGLGLTTTYSIIQKHGGHIMVTSKVAEGSTFTFYLPAIEQALAPPPAKEAPLPPLAGPARILIMDDEPSIRQLLERMLEKAGFATATAANGLEAVELFRKARQEGCPFDAAILDLTIPGGMGGKETVARLRELDPRVKAIVSSGYSTDATMSDYGAHGFVGVVAKPYRQQELVAILRHVLAG